MRSFNHSIFYAVLTNLIAYGDPSTEAFSHASHNIGPKLPLPHGIDGSPGDYWVTRDDLHTIYLSVCINSHSYHDRSYQMKLVDRTRRIDGFSFLQERLHLA